MDTGKIDQLDLPMPSGSANHDEFDPQMANCIVADAASRVGNGHRDVNENHTVRETIRNSDTVPVTNGIAEAIALPPAGPLTGLQLSNGSRGAESYSTTSSKCGTVDPGHLPQCKKHPLNLRNFESATIKQRLEDLLSGTENDQAESWNFSESESSDTSEAVNSEGTTPVIPNDSLLSKEAVPSAISQEGEESHELFSSDDRDVPFVPKTVPVADILDNDDDDDLEVKYLKQIDFDVDDLDNEVLSEESLSASSKILEESIIRGRDIENLPVEQQSSFEVTCPRDWGIEGSGANFVGFSRNDDEEPELCKMSIFTESLRVDNDVNVNNFPSVQMESNSEKQTETLPSEDIAPDKQASVEPTSKSFPSIITGEKPDLVPSATSTRDNPKFHFLGMEEFWESDPATETSKDGEEAEGFSLSWPGVSRHHRLLRRRQLSQHENRRTVSSANASPHAKTQEKQSPGALTSENKQSNVCEPIVLPCNCKGEFSVEDEFKASASGNSRHDSKGKSWLDDFASVKHELGGRGDNLSTNDEQKLSLLETDSSYVTGDSINSSENETLSEDDPMTPELFFDALPTEITMNIYSYFTPKELLLYVAPVCRKWYEMAHDPILWQQFVVHANENIDSYELCKIIRRATLLKHLSLRARDKLNITEIKMITIHCMHLQKLNLGFCDNVNEKIIDVITQNCKNLECVNVEGCEKITDKCISYLASLPKLKSLNMSHCIKITDTGIINLAVLCEKLGEVNIDGIPWITDNAVKLLATERKHILKAVYLDGAEMTDVTVEYISQCKNLQVLSVSFAEQFTDISLRYIKALRNLRHLRLKRGVEYSDKAMTEMFLCRNLHQLTHLNLTECSELSDKALEYIAKGCKKLHHMALCWCWDITETGLVHVIDNCREMETLDLLGLDKILGTCFMRIPEKMPKLHFLDLRQCHRISDSMLTELVLKKRNLVIINYYGDEVMPYTF
ncbi:uncharacterized protein [Ptychodera flava]|uniref:uncharacterized protein n=1 Tax=Ptychodera flava TaxID=63121 RepID=UPI00396A26BF